MSYLRYNSSRFVRQTPSRTPCLQLTLEPWPYPTLQGRVGWGKGALHISSLHLPWLKIVSLNLADDTFVCLRSINMERPISDMDRLPYAKYTEMRKRLETEKLADTEVDKLYDIVQVTAGLFDKNAIRYTIEGGTLLGAVRNGDLIKHDSEADFDVLKDDLAKIKSLNSNFAEYGLDIIDVLGWGLQIAHTNSLSFAPGLWTDCITQWTFLDLIAIRSDETTAKHILAQDVAPQDYQTIFLTKSDCENPFERVQFGHLKLWAIAGCKNRRAYLDRH
ncbi:unnamed protein product [Didymodactylos carnosus]|uniref:LicD/FKTN/FKRP nucleotidyltransferase domain-containing protein n=1 Tax=Didymodactylos carnosus TaxID=1234261 RepID=A0A8S2CZL3_9BILA|nr:unnamed protein product [Didymodactylos carnosus]CAF3559994.1 unnamed protein product [Didymodactylos carnosus]